MKKYMILLPAMAFAFAGCDQDELDIPQKGVKSIETFYKTDADAEAAVAKVYVDTQKNFAFLPEVNGYNYGPYMALTNFQADDIYFAGSGPEDCVPEREFHDFRYGNENIVPLGAYTALYRSIHKCNLVINNFEKLSDLTPVMKRCVAEARVMRAFDHLVLGIYWGKPAIVDKVLTGESRPANAESQATVMQWVADEIDLALPDLDERESQDDQEGAYRATKGFANAVKGKALIWKGDYDGAKKALKEVISSNKYDLIDDMSKIMHADGKGTKESVFELNYVFVEGVTDGGESVNRVNCNGHMTFNWRWEYFNSTSDERLYTTGWGWINPTGKFARDLIENDGMDSKRRKAWIVTYDEILNNFSWEDSSNKGMKAGQEWHGCEGYFNWKTVMHPAQGDMATDRQQRNYPIMRYAEVLLLYAEACAQTNDNDGLEYLNKVQQRAGSKHISGQLTLAEVQREKQFELWLEGTRSADLIRWGMTENLENQDFYTPSFGVDEKGNSYINEDGADYYKVTYGETLGFKKGKDEFLPFPKNAIDLNNALQQNPGWN